MSSLGKIPLIPRLNAAASRYLDQAWRQVVATMEKTAQCYASRSFTQAEERTAWKNSSRRNRCSGKKTCTLVNRRTTPSVVRLILHLGAFVIVGLCVVRNADRWWLAFLLSVALAWI